MIAPWQRGESLTASKLNEGVEAVNALASMHSTPIGVAIFVEVIDVLADALKVRPFGVNDLSISFDFYVAKPWLLRTSPFGGGTIKRPDKDGVTYTMVYSSVHERVVTNTSTSDTETQVIIPQYVHRQTVGGVTYHGDVLLVQRQVMEEINVELTVGAEKVKVEWVDTNEGGRIWCKKSA